MSKIHRMVGTIEGTRYFNTLKEMDSFVRAEKICTESCARVDAAAMCNLLEQTLGETEQRLSRVQQMLYELVLAYPGDITQTEIGTRVQQYCIANKIMLLSRQKEV